MSEEIDIDSNNLCTSEDAFEQFSANSIYNEDEFITLADIVSPTYKEQESNNDLMEIPYDNEVVVSSNSIQDHQHVNTTCTTENNTGKVENADNEFQSSPKQDENPSTTSVVSSDIMKSPNTKRVRKKRTYYEDDDFSPYNKNTGRLRRQSVKTLPNSNNLDQDSLTPTKNKRGRKPKNRTQETLVQQSPIVGNSSIQGASDASISGLIDEEKNCEIITTPIISHQKRRPGRPKKIKDLSISEPDSTISNESLNNIHVKNDAKTESSMKTKRRVRKRNVNMVVQNTSNYDISKMPNSLDDSEANTNTDLKSILEGVKPSRRSSQNILTEISSTEGNDTGPIKTMSNYENEHDEIVNQLNQMFSDEETKTVSQNTKSKAEENTDAVEISASSIAKSSLEAETENTNVHNINPRVIKTRRKKRKIRKTGSNEQKTNDTTNVNPNTLITLNDDDGEDICLSKLKEKMKPISTENTEKELINDNNVEQQINIETIEGELTDNDNVEQQVTSIEMDSNIVDESSTKRTAKVPIMDDFEYNIDSLVADTDDLRENSESLLVEDMSKRSVRKKKEMHYEVDSDEDPFANVELSEDEEPRRNRKGKYNSDDEYIPSMEIRRKRTTSESGSDIMDQEENIKKLPKKRRNYKKIEGGSPKKKSKKNQELVEDDVILSIDCDQDNDIEESTVIKLNKTASTSSWGNTNEFENFLAKKISNSNIKIKKCTNHENKSITPLEIPVIDQNKVKNFVDEYSQTTVTESKTVSSQTDALYDITMNDNVTLSNEQSEKACEFLNNVVTTTAELGRLMTEKSEDFIKKKINTAHVTDTIKMDYCVKKSFLLFKLAKHNLEQMEEDLATQYEDFLKDNDLLKHRLEPKKLTPKPSCVNDDSDCEIVEVVNAKTDKIPKFNPKTVFLNKELSIKIAKKPTEAEKRLQIKGKHAVWINDSVMVKKVQSKQSFLVQDSRNEKPPDHFVTARTKTVSDLFKNHRRQEIIANIVNDFFKNYNKQKIKKICAPFTSTDWLKVNKPYVCNYFVVTTDLVAGASTGTCSNGDGGNRNISQSDTVTSLNSDLNGMKPQIKFLKPESLLTLCTWQLQKHLFNKNNNTACHILNGELSTAKSGKVPLSLLQLCINALSVDHLTKTSTLGTNVFMNDSLSCSSSISLCDSTFDEAYNLDDLQETGVINNPGNLFKVCLDVVNEHLNKSRCSIKTLDCLIKIDESQSFSVLTLKSICYKKIANTYFGKESSDMQLEPHAFSALSLQTISYNNILKQFFAKEISCKLNKNDLKTRSCCSLGTINERIDESGFPPHKELKVIKTLISLCIEKIQSSLVSTTDKYIFDGRKCRQLLFNPDSLKRISLNNINNIDFANATVPKGSTLNGDNFTIDCVNTLSEEAFHNLEHTTLNNREYRDMGEGDSHDFNDEYEDDFEYQEEHNNTEDNWLSQVQLQEPRSCITPITAPIAEKEAEITMPIITQLKLEPEDALENEVDTSIVKTEPLHSLNEMIVIPENIVTKSEVMVTDHSNSNNIQTRAEADRQDYISYPLDTFESFVQGNKIIQSLDNDNAEEVFTQSMFRVRRQFEPDYEDINDLNNSLLIPQTFEPLLENAKGSLMETSSDDGTSSKKIIGKKKMEKRKVRAKKIETKINKDTASTSKDKAATANDLVIMTRRMRDRIRQEEKKIQSSDSETDNIILNNLKEKDKKIDKKFKGKEKEGLSSKPKGTPYEKLASDKNSKAKDIPLLKNNYTNDNEIQCNAVDSTEQVNEADNSCNADEQLTSTVSLEDNISSDINVVNDHFLSSILDFSEPAEMLECEPTMPVFDSVREKKMTRATLKKNRLELNVPELKKDKPTGQNSIDTTTVNTEIVNKVIEQNTYTDRDGWHCYPLNGKDKKLYENAFILLDKLPEAFVETYFRYQNITVKTKEDQEVDRLTNLSTLSRTSNVKDGKLKSKHKSIEDAVQSTKAPDNDDSRPVSPTYSDHCAELTPSEDEGDNDNNAAPSPIPFTKPTTENNLAKTSLMNDNESDAETNVTIKEEPSEESVVKRRPGPKSKTMVSEKPKTEDLMLTADKMMNKELTLLHTPVVLKDGTPEVVPKNPVSKPKQKTSSRPERSTKERMQAEENSSSEEEKQWVNTKEKLLKRLGKKEDATADDAKRAKLVSEFIVKRGVGPDSRTRRKPAKPRRSKKKFLERQKQLRVLSRELLGEPAGKKYSQPLMRGRRNIRKVINKKSLATSTVIANVEELERKRRLCANQNKLRELLGCEEDVNVLVINDEVCLEYDFEEERPVVTIHPFFTKVMKAHQYEGVKFMWDACFESLEMIQSGHPGGGCILAHCMGLGKTLQVLALLHTVLTHPKVGMSRVLVCCPLSTVLNWVDEIHKWIGPVTNQIKVFELSKLRKTYERAYQLEDWYSGGGIFIIGYELFRSLTTLDPDFDDIRPTIITKIRTALLDPGPDIIVCDEGHLLKNDCSVLAVAMSRVVTKRRIVLTGTPMQNNLREYYCMVNFVKPNLLGKYSEYSNRFENPIMNGQHRDSSEEDIKLMKARTHILHKVLEGCLQRQEASVLYPYLPKKHEYTVFIPLTKCQWDLYKYYIEKYGRKSKQSTLKDFHILQKIWSHPQVLHNFQTKNRDEKNKIKVEKLEDDLAREDLVSEDIKPEVTEEWWMKYLDDERLNGLESSNKFVAVFRILDECNTLGDKVLIFSTSLFSLDGLEYFLKKINNWSLGQEYYRLDGSVPAEVRQKWCREFNAENNRTTKLFLISTRAGCLGLNMTAANRVIILDTSWNPAHDIQSIFRVYRFGQKKDCYIYRLVALGTMEQKIYERSVTKQAVACRVVDEQQIDRHYNMAELTELYQFDELGMSVASGVAVGVSDVALLRVARDAAVHAVYEHDSLLRDSNEQGLPEHERNAAWMQFQQEHAHKQMQNELEKKNEQMKMQALQSGSQPLSDKNSTTSRNTTQEKAKKGKKSKVANVQLSLRLETSKEVNKKENNVNRIIPSPSSETTISADERKAFENEPDLESDDNSKKDVDYVPRYSLRDKKGKKHPTQSPPVNIQEKPPTVPPPLTNMKPIKIDKFKIMEEEQIQGVTQILKRHNFNANNEPNKIMALVNNVVNLVFGGGTTVDDDLSKHIASFTIQRHVNTVPILRHVICEAINRNIREESTSEPSTRKRGRSSRQKEKEADRENKKSPSSSVVTPIIEISVTNNVEKRELRRKTRGAEKKDDSQNVIELIDDPIPVVVNPAATSKPRSKKKKIETVNDSESILLSDEDDVPVKSEAKTQPEKQNPTIKVDKNLVKPVEEKITLHPSLLTNKHFIKIVAHKYLDGNKMLDEDAAILAAKYSTAKALQEYEATGKAIVSGPIYNIAIDVLGTDFLRKVNLSNPTPKPISPVREPLVAPIIRVKQDLTDVPEVPVQTKDLSESKAKQRPLCKQLKVTSEPVRQPTPPSNLASTSILKPAPRLKSAPHLELAPHIVPTSHLTLAPTFLPNSRLTSAPHLVPSSGITPDQHPIPDLVPLSHLMPAPHQAASPHMAPASHLASTSHLTPTSHAATTSHMTTFRVIGTSLDSSSYLVPTSHLSPIQSLGSAQQISAQPQPVHGNNVVPVGLFRTTTMPNQAFLPPADSECIFPDDDDCRIINNEPTIGSANSPVISDNNSVPVGLVQRNPQSLLLSSATNGASGMPQQIVSSPIEQPTRPILPQQVTPATQKTNIIKIAGNIIKDMTSYETSKPPNQQTSPVPGASNDLICLDSDDEESITPHIEPSKSKNKTKLSAQSKEVVRPILGSLMAVGPQGQMIPVIPHTQVSPINATNKSNKKYTVVMRKRGSYDDIPPPPPPSLDIDKGVLSQTNVLRLTQTGNLVMDMKNNVGESQVTQLQGFVAPSSQMLEKVSVPENIEAPENTSIPESTPLPEKAPTLRKTLVPEKASVPEKDDVIRIHNESSSDSDSSRTGSPYDPLSILKDVVQIRDADEPPQQLNHKKGQVQTKKKIAEKNNVGTHGKTKQLNTNMKVQSSSSSCLLKNNAEMSFKNTEKLIKSGNNELKKSTIDLTKTATTSSKSRNFIDKQNVEKHKIKKPEGVNISGVKVVGTTKNLMFQGKSITTNDGSAPKQIVTNSASSSSSGKVTLKYPKVISSQIQNTEKRRLSVATPSSAPKKQKFNTKMTLEDFNIDDFDIIELE